MKYEEHLKKALKEGSVKELVALIKTDWEPGEVIVGELVEIRIVHFDETNNDVNGYLFHTDDGIIQFTMGAGTDMQVDGKMTIGHVYACTFIGKKDISRGRTLNLFKVLDCGEAL